MGYQLGEKRRAEAAKTPANSGPGDGHELIESNDRALSKPGVAKLRMIGADQELGRRQRFLRNDGGEIRHHEVRSGGLGGEDDSGAELHGGQVREGKRDKDYVPSEERAGQTGSPSSRE